MATQQALTAPDALLPAAAPAHSEASELLAWDEAVRDLLQLPSDVGPQQVPRPFVLETQEPAFSEVTNNSDSSTTALAQSHKALPLWGSVLLAKDRTAMERLITAQTQAGCLVKLVAGRKGGRRQMLVLEDQIEGAMLEGLQPLEEMHSNSAQSSAGDLLGLQGFLPNPEDLPEDLEALDSGVDMRKKKKRRRRRAHPGKPVDHIDAADLASGSGLAGYRGSHPGLDLQEGGADEGFGESVPVKRKRPEDEAAGSSSRMSAADYSGAAASNTEDVQHSDNRGGGRASVRQRRSHDITWFMALRDASQPRLPHTDVSKLLPTSYEGAESEGSQGEQGAEGTSDGKVLTGYEDEGTASKAGASSAATRSERRAEALTELRNLYTGGLQQTRTSLTFSRMRLEAAFFVSSAQRWAYAHLTTHSLFMILLLVTLTCSVMPSECELNPEDGSVGGVGQVVRRLMLAAVRLFGIVTDCAATLIRHLVSSLTGSSSPAPPEKPPLGGNLAVQQFILTHLLVHVVVALPLRLLYALPHHYRLVLLEPVTQAVHIATYVAHLWCPLCSCQNHHQLLPDAIMLCRNWLYLAMFPARWCRSRWTQGALLLITFFAMWLDPSVKQDLLIVEAAKSQLERLSIAVPFLSGLRWNKLLVALGCLERALPWVVQISMQCVWLYVSELVNRSAFLVRRTAKRTRQQR